MKAHNRLSIVTAYFKNTIFLCQLFALFFAIQFEAMAKQEDIDIEFSAKTEKQVFHAGEAIKVKLVIRNKGLSGVTTEFAGDADYYFGFINIEKDAVKVEKTTKGKKYNLDQYSGSQSIFIQNNVEETIDLEPLNLYYDLSVAGKYAMTFFVTITDKNSKEHTLKDNFEIEITDVEKKDDSKTLEKIKNNWSEQQDGTLISVASNKEKYPDYGPVMVRVAVKNATNKAIPVKIFGNNIFDFYNLSMNVSFMSRDSKDESKKNENRVITLTRYGKNLQKGRKNQPQKTTLKTNEEQSYIFVLNQIFDMSEDGTYSLVLSHKSFDDTSKPQTWTSDPLIFHVGKGNQKKN